MAENISHDKTTAVLFARWVSICYGETANKMSGRWWRDTLHIFETVVLPSYIANGSKASFDSYLAPVIEIESKKEKEKTKRTKI